MLGKWFGSLKCSTRYSKWRIKNKLSTKKQGGALKNKKKEEDWTFFLHDAVKTARNNGTKKEY